MTVAAEPPAPQRALGADLVAGVSIAGLLLPEAVAYSGIAGLPPQAGVVALLAGLIAYGSLGTSRFAIVSATSSSAALLMAATGSVDGADAALRMALSCGLILLTGLFFVLAGLMRLGASTSLIAKPVLRGFAFGLALTIALRQLPKIVGVHPAHADVFRLAWDLGASWPRWNLAGLAIGAGALAVLSFGSRWRLVPGALLVIAAGIALDASGFTASHGVPAVGPISLAFERPAWPRLASDEWLRLGELAFAMVLMLYAESYGAIRTFAIAHGDALQPNRDLVALGVANLASGLCQGMPVGAGFSATSANEAAGARSRLAGWVAAAVVLGLVLTLLAWIERTPEPVLAAIVIHAVGRSIDPAGLRQYFAWRRDRLVVMAALAAVLVLGVLDGLLAGIAASLMVMLRDLSVPRVAWLGRLGESHDYIDLQRHPEAKPVPGLLIARPDTPLFFANADRIFAAIRARAEDQSPLSAVILSLEESPDLDSTSIEALKELAQALERRGSRLLLARVKDPVRDVLEAVRAPELPSSCYLSWSVADAVEEAARLTRPGQPVR